MPRKNGHVCQSVTTDTLNSEKNIPIKNNAKDYPNAVSCCMTYVPLIISSWEQPTLLVWHISAELEVTPVILGKTNTIMLKLIQCNIPT